MPREPVHPQRIASFAKFFKNYMGVSSLVTAALPIPVASFKLIPVYDSQNKILAVYTPMFCFLLLAFVFYIRHGLARLMFPSNRPNAALVVLRGLVRALPLLLMGLCIGVILYYHTNLADAQAVASRKGASGDALSEWITPHQQAVLMVEYILIFLTAEGAFVLMAIREYIQDLLGFTDQDVILGPRKPASLD